MHFFGTQGGHGVHDTVKTDSGNIKLFLTIKLLIKGFGENHEISQRCGTLAVFHRDVPSLSVRLFFVLAVSGGWVGVLPIRKSSSLIVGSGVDAFGKRVSIWVWFVHSTLK